MNSDVTIWMPHYFGQIALETKGMSVAEKWGYVAFLEFCWLQGGHAPSDKNLLRKITEMTPKRLERILLLFREDSHGIYHPKMLPEYHRALGNRSRRQGQTAQARSVLSNQRASVTGTVTESVTAPPTTIPSPAPQSTTIPKPLSSSSTPTNPSPKGEGLREPTAKTAVTGKDAPRAFHAPREIPEEARIGIEQLIKSAR